MDRLKLQYSLICQKDERSGFKNIIHGFTAGMAPNFYVVNKWVWDTNDELTDGFFQVTELIRDGEIVSSSQSDLFMIKLAHTHHNLFAGISFTKEGNYRIRVNLFDQQGSLIEEGSLEYPLFIA
ncbi:hypothetical protein [Halocella sp. SP3-1]|uniref:hypothetical protein n=1 Tax=Halocella sp. SP3-1 TaxID=2382161 RepID=UPI000F75F505|nr:hypothetical protein [Halocella sp. SP3-1]AZO93461.1 hypothetical protein D7D81_01965 [Halocella sp. SP3-1]